jgi:glutaredoxin
MATHVTLYVKRDCTHCDRARTELVRRAVAFIEIDVTARPEIVPELLKLTKGRRIVPVVVEGARIAIASDGGSEF